MNNVIFAILVQALHLDAVLAAARVDSAGVGDSLNDRHPEFDLLRTRKVVETSEDGSLTFGALLLGVAADAQSVLSEQIRHSILQVTLS